LRFCSGTVEALFGLRLSRHSNTTQYTSGVCVNLVLTPEKSGRVGMTAPVRLDRASLDALRDGSIDAADAARLADALRIKPGERSWATRAALAKRDDLVREYARRFYAGISRNQQAERIARDLTRYEASAWQNARAAPECPHRDPRRQLLFRILKVRPVPPKARTINEILSVGA